MLIKILYLKLICIKSKVVSRSLPTLDILTSVLIKCHQHKKPKLKKYKHTENTKNRQQTCNKP